MALSLNLDKARYCSQTREERDAGPPLIRFFMLTKGPFLSNWVSDFNLTFFDGGVAYCGTAEADYDAFLSAYAREVAMGRPKYVVERSTTTVRFVPGYPRPDGLQPRDLPKCASAFRPNRLVIPAGEKPPRQVASTVLHSDPIVAFFFELDVQRLAAKDPDNEAPNCVPGSPLDALKGNPELQRTWILQVASVVFSVLAHSFPDEPEVQNGSALWCIVCNHHGDDKKPEWQTGFHIHFPKLRLRLSVVSQLRRSMVAALDFALPCGLRENSWDARFDETPFYASSGLRLVGSYKATRCGACAKQPPGGGIGTSRTALLAQSDNSCDASCDECGGSRFVSQNRRYLPWLKLRWDGAGSKGPRSLASAERPVGEGVVVAENYRPELGFSHRYALLRDLVLMCSIKYGILDGVTNPWPQSYVYDARFSRPPAAVQLCKVLSNGKRIKARSALGAGGSAGGEDPRRSAVYTTKSPSEPQAGAAAVAMRGGKRAAQVLISDTDAFDAAGSAVEELVGMLPKLFGCPQWEGLRLKKFEFFRQLDFRSPPLKDPVGTLTGGRRGDANIFVIVTVVSNPNGPANFCQVKGGLHNSNTIYFEVYPPETRPVMAGMSGDIPMVVYDKNGNPKTELVGFAAQRCFSPKKAGDVKCASAFHTVRYPTEIMERVFPSHVLDIAEKLQRADLLESASQFVPASLPKPVSLTPPASADEGLAPDDASSSPSCTPVALVAATGKQPPRQDVGGGIGLTAKGSGKGGRPGDTTLLAKRLLSLERKKNPVFRKRLPKRGAPSDAPCAGTKKRRAVEAAQ